MGKIKSPSELTIQENIKALLYGQPGIGKTTLALSAPSPLLLDFDGGIHRVNAVHLKHTVQVRSWEDIIELLEQEDLSPFRTLVIDTAGKMIEFMSDFIIRKDPRLKQSDGSLSLKGYGARKVLFKSFLNRVSMLGKNLVFIAHEIEERDGDKRFVRPEVGGSSGNDLVKELDLVGYMQAIGLKRTISFNATEKFYGKNTCNLPDVIEVPETKTSKNELLGEIFRSYETMLSEKIQMTFHYTNLLKEQKAKVDDIETVDKINEYLSEVKVLNHIWDSKLQLAHYVKEKAESLGLIFDRQSGAYVAAMADEVVADSKNEEVEQTAKNELVKDNDLKIEGEETENLAEAGELSVPDTPEVNDAATSRRINRRLTNN